MITLKSRRPGLRSTIQRWPVVAAGVGFLTVLLTPFVFFPEIMGDAGVTYASTLRNGAALAFLFVGALVMLAGLASFGWQLLHKPRAKLQGHHEIEKA